MPVLTVIDVSGIQPYIFGSNHLRESIGASEIVARATSLWVFNALREVKGADDDIWKTNVLDIGSTNPFDRLNKDAHIENGLDAEVIYAGGGNTLIVFQSLDHAKTFANNYTKRLVARAPGLNVVLAHSDEFDVKHEDCDVRDVGLKTAMERINQKKANRKLSTPLLGSAVTAQCTSTGGVASFNPLDVAESDEERETLEDKYQNSYVSAEARAKLKMVRIANKRLQDELLNNSAQFERVRGEWQAGKSEACEVVMPFKFDNLGRTEGEASFMAVIHTDGNGIGKRVKEYGKLAANSRDWINNMRDLSESIYDANLASLRLMIELLTAHVKKGVDENGKARLFVIDKRSESFALKEEKRKDKGVEKNFSHLPIRPLIFGGEDVAFVCDGRLALALTVFYLKQMQKQLLKDNNPPFSRAGVAIVKAHYPFARAYSLAEDLAGNAKERINDIDPKDKQVSALDWHLAMTGLAGGISEIRESEYLSDENKKLYARPLSLKERNTTDWRVWDDFEQVVNEFQTDWKEKRNKVKRLREELRRGPGKAKEFMKLTGEKLPPMKNKIEESGGWHGDRCAYFDAIEMIDIFYQLDEERLNSEQQAAGQEDESA